MTQPTAHLHATDHAASLRDVPVCPVSYCLHTGAGTYPEPCEHCDGRGYLLSSHASPTCVEETDCDECTGSGITGRRLCSGCDAVVDHVATVLADPRLAAMLRGVLEHAGMVVRERAARVVVVTSGTEVR